MSEPQPNAVGHRAWWHLDLVGAAFAVLFFCLSLTPSLLPRPWYLQGAISGILAATGYVVAAFCAFLVRRFTPWRMSSRKWWFAWRALFVVSPIIVALFIYQGAQWQRQIYLLMDLTPPAGWAYLGVPVLAAAIFAAFLSIARLLRALARAIGRFLGRWIPAPAARISGAAAVMVLTIFVLQGFVANVLMDGANDSFKAINGETSPGAAPPRASDVSGSAASLVPWSSLGRYGRDFVTSGPQPADLERFSGQSAKQPIRAYVGLDAANEIKDRAALAVRELERAGAFGRKVLCVITTTGTGWVDRRPVDTLEYMYNGDSALVALQYSYLPSWLSFIVDRDRVRAAGRELFNQVYARWEQLAVAERPKLLVYGESLGALGAESAFSGVDDMRNRTDGMLLVGPPNTSELWREFISSRDSGTGEVRPTYQGGQTVRFVGDPADLTVPPGPWHFPRVAYLQHPSDPVVWWTPRLMLNRPDWLAERRGSDVLPRMRWYPFVTFWQLTADLVYSINVPDGHGHDYGSEQVDAWAQIASPPGWTAERTAALRTLISQIPEPLPR